MKWHHIEYLIVTGGSGATRMVLDDLTGWLDRHPGYMIIRIKSL